MTRPTLLIVSLSSLALLTTYTYKNQCNAAPTRSLQVRCIYYTSANKDSTLAKLHDLGALRQIASVNNQPRYEVTEDYDEAMLWLINKYVEQATKSPQQNTPNS